MYLCTLYADKKLSAYTLYANNNFVFCLLSVKCLTRASWSMEWSSSPPLPTEGLLRLGMCSSMRWGLALLLLQLLFPRTHSTHSSDLVFSYYFCHSFLLLPLPLLLLLLSFNHTTPNIPSSYVYCSFILLLLLESPTCTTPTTATSPSTYFYQSCLPARMLWRCLVRRLGVHHTFPGTGHSTLPNNGILKNNCCNIPF